MAKKEIEQTEIEAPYELPEGWKWCRLGDVAEIIMGQSPAGTSMTENQNDIAFIGGASDMGEEMPNISRYTSEPTKLSKRDDVIVCIRATLGRPIFSDGIYCLGRGVAGIRSETLMKEYIKYGFLNFEQYLYDKATGSTFLQVSSKYLNEMPFPLPPTLAEQQRIVNRIESMFAKLDKAKEKAQNVVDSFETRKAAILHKAFTGELTAKWRKENGVSLNISESTFKGICHKITDGFHNSPKPVSEGYPYIMAGDIKENGIDFNNGLFMDKKNHDELYNKAHPEKGDILVVNIGAGTGKSAIIDVDFEFSFKNCAILKLNKDIVNPMYVYLFFYLKKDYILKEITRGGAQPFLSLKMINELTISYPSLPEQVEIVRILDIIIEKENNAKQAAEAMLEQIELLKKSILARAFRGEL